MQIIAIIAIGMNSHRPQVVLHEFEHASQTKERELQDAVDENNDLKVQLIEAKEEASQLSNECKQLNLELLESKSIAAKSEAALLEKAMELEVFLRSLLYFLFFSNECFLQVIQAQLAEFKKLAENVTSDLESKIEASASKIGNLESNLAASENALKALSESTAVQISTAELERIQLQDQIKERDNQVVACKCFIMGNSMTNHMIPRRKQLFWAN